MGPEHTPSSGGAASSPAPTSTFIEGTINDMRTVNPWKALETPEYEVLSLNFDLLENFDKNNLSAAPGIATDWTQSADGQTWTFNIRDDVTWQDGQPFTANDIAFTYNKTLECKLGNSLDYLVPDFTESITATSPDHARMEDEGVPRARGSVRRGSTSPPSTSAGQHVVRPDPEN